MRWFLMILLVGICMLPGIIVHAETNEMSLILEVEGSSAKVKKQVEVNSPFVEVVATYDTLFQGIAIKGKPKNMESIIQEDFIKAVYPVQNYQTLSLEKPFKQNEFSNIAFPGMINQTSYTGKGVKVGVIDTGIDRSHPDLKNNIQGGFDMVDLDDDPQETTKEEGIPTFHGTHVAGIIAANGELKGVAPDSDIYAYRALGPGGAGTSIQVMAAMEEAVKDGVDVMNLSLGNTVNGPDYPTSKAVNEAVEQGVAVIVANGNTGPENWTVGAPATASAAMSVGAYQNVAEQQFLVDPKSKREIHIKPIQIDMPWNLKRDNEITEEIEKSRGKIGMMAVKEEKVDEVTKAFQDAGAKGILIEAIEGETDWLSPLIEAPPTIPVAIITPEDYDFIQKQLTDEQVYFKPLTKEQPATIAPFSSHGPVTLNWMIKPDIIAPGVNIISTVPGGYDILNGTSMATPHMTGAFAVLKEAHPNWSNNQITGALKTTAKKLDNIEPIAQGTGEVQIKEAINTEVIIENPLLSFGKTSEHINEREVTLSIENISDQDKQFRFMMPKKEKGVTWKIPQSFSIEAGEKKEVPITMKVNSMQMEREMLQGWLHLKSREEAFTLPYIAVQKEANYPRITGFTFQLDVKDQDYYSYELYAAEKVKSIELQLYDPDTLKYKGKIGSWEDIEIGMNEGQIKRSDIKQKGLYYGLLLVQDEQGTYFNYETEVYLE